MNILVIDPKEIALRPPRKYDESLYCKIDYADKKKTLFVFESVKLVGYKEGSNTLCIKPGKGQVIARILEVENVVLNLVAQNLEAWFDDRIPPEKLDANFHSCATILPEVGKALKLKLATKPDADTGIQKIASGGQLCTIKIQLYAIRFSKNAFQLMWKVHSVEEMKKTSLTWLDDDAESCMSNPELEDLELENCIDLEEIYGDMKTKLLQVICDLEKRLETVRAFKADVDAAMATRNVSELLQLSDRIAEPF